MRSRWIWRIYRACHRELCAHEAASPLKVVNFLELVGDAMGVEKPDCRKNTPHLLSPRQFAERRLESADKLPTRP